MPLNPKMTLTVTITMADSTTFSESSGVDVTGSEVRLKQYFSDLSDSVIADYLAG